MSIVDIKITRKCVIIRVQWTYVVSAMIELCLFERRCLFAERKPLAYLQRKWVLLPHHLLLCWFSRKKLLILSYFVDIKFLVSIRKYRRIENNILWDPGLWTYYLLSSWSHHMILFNSITNIAENKRWYVFQKRNYAPIPYYEINKLSAFYNSSKRVLAATQQWF